MAINAVVQPLSPQSNATKRVCLDLSILDLLNAVVQPLSPLAIHGNICLGLRHPDNTGPTRKIAENVITTIEKIFQDTGMENDVIAEIHTVEAEETMRLIEAKRKGEL